jgi:hypothetical protein
LAGVGLGQNLERPRSTVRGRGRPARARAPPPARAARHALHAKYFRNSVRIVCPWRRRIQDSATMQAEEAAADGGRQPSQSKQAAAAGSRASDRPSQSRQRGRVEGKTAPLQALGFTSSSFHVHVHKQLRGAAD